MLLLIVAASCSSGRHLARIGHSVDFAVGMYTPVGRYHIMQAVDRNFYLAVDDASVNPSVIAISTSNKIKPMYEGQKLKGIYVMIDVYSYETMNGKRKTIPLVVPVRDYEDMQYAEKLKKKQAKIRQELDMI